MPTLEGIRHKLRRERSLSPYDAADPARRPLCGGSLSTPHAIAIDRGGRLLVGDRENNRVQIIDRTGRWLGEIGGLYKPRLGLAPDGSIFVAEMGPDMLTRLSPIG